jgi:DNA-binding response OmpR family regulator
VIDDHETTGGAIADYCKMNGIDCIEINDGKSGLFEILRHKYNLIILDIAMPEFTGLDILNQLKKERASNLNIIVLTATNLKKSDFATYKDLGISKVMRKPIGLDQLDQMIKQNTSQVAPIAKLIRD